MLNKITPVVRVAASAARPLASVRSMNSYIEKMEFDSNVEIVKYTKASMDFMPVPAGDWKENRDRLNRTYNIQFAISILGMIGTYALMKNTGTANYMEVRNHKKLNIDPSKPIEE